MMNYEMMLNPLSWTLIVLVMCLTVNLIWKNRKLYYYSSQLPGPIPWPLIGNIYTFSGGLGVFCETVIDLMKKYPPIFKFWLGRKFIIVNAVPEDVKIILSTYMEKSELYEFTKDLFGNGLLTAPVDIWKKHRKMINPSFNTKILTSFIETFSRNSKNLAENLKTCSEEDDLIPILWNCTLSAACETLADVNASQITGLDDYISRIVKVEQLITFRFFSILYTSNTIWKYSHMHNEMQTLCSEIFEFVNKVVKTRKINKLTTTDEIRNELFLNHLLELKENDNSITDEEIKKETHTLLVAASETSAFTLGFALLVLSIHTNVQKKIYEELYSIFGNDERDATLEDLNRMDYTESVIKETLRLLPSGPLIMRRADRDMEISNSVIYPEGSNIVIPIVWLHRNPKYWRDPLKFDPDRFLSEDTEKRHYCTFIPFSFGSRNCIGFKYGMLSMKVMLSTILRHYEVSSTQYKSIWDIQTYFHIVTKPKGGCRVVLTRRKNKVLQTSTKNEIYMKQG